LSEKTSVGGSASLLSSKKPMAFLIAICLVSVGAIGYIAANSSTTVSKSLPVVETGDTVYVDYVGMFADNPGGWVFDTSKRVVAYDNSLVKSLFFHIRDDNQYTPLNFTAGLSQDFLQPFVTGVVGMSVYQTKRIFVPIEDGYSLVPAQIVDLPIVMDVPMLQNLTYAQFQSTYKADPLEGFTVTHIFWGWDATVEKILGDKVYLQSNPVVGQIVSSFGNPEKDPRDGWYQEVISVDPSANGGEGLIRVLNKVSIQDAYQRRGTNFDGTTFTILDVNESANRLTVINNSDTYVGELSGRALIFDVTVTAIRKS